jgi:hypothetical protein
MIVTSADKLTSEAAGSRRLNSKAAMAARNTGESEPAAEIRRQQNGASQAQSG